jgi:hypothetical protein
VKEKVVPFETSWVFTEKIVLRASDELHVSITLICYVQCPMLYVNILHKRLVFGNICVHPFVIKCLNVATYGRNA